MKSKFILVFLFFILSANIFAQGNWLWAKSATGASPDEGFAVCTDTAGNVFVTGEFQSPILTFGSVNLVNTGAWDIFIAKYDPNGNVLWAKRAGGGSGDEAFSICADQNGNIFITGTYSSSSITFGSTTITNAGGYDIFIAKYDANGNALWAKSEGGTGTDVGYGVSADATGNVYLTGYFFSPTMTIGTTLLTNAGSSDIFIAKYDPNGNALWAKSCGSTGGDEGVSVVADHSGNAVLSGFFFGPSISIGTNTLTNAGSYDIFIAKYDANGNVLWANGAGGTGDDEGYSLCADANSNVFLTGYFQSNSIVFGTNTLTNPGVSNDAFLVKYDPNGNAVWSKNATGINDKGYSVSADASGSVYMSGEFVLSVTFGSTTLSMPSNFTEPMFLARFDPNGNLLCAEALSSGGDDQNGIAADSFGNVYIGGDFYVSPFVIGSDTLTSAGAGDEDVFVAKYHCGNETGIDQSNIFFTPVIFPNPSNGNFILQNNFTGKYDLSIFNSLGQEILRNENLNENNFEIDLSADEDGIYFIRITNRENIFSQKIIIQH
ncbi:MAG: T9SS type A sorting domain-containing protein [Bacteroidetes bacterium]|nr:T9SS type A sorting domain-containing protein [Bacteroidota bacterium]